MAGETTTSSLSVDQVAFDRLAYFALRSELLFDQAADVQPVQQAMPGTGVTFTIFSDIAAATSTLSETTDVTPVALADSQVTVTLYEYGNAVVTTAKLRGTAFLDVDSAAANIIGYNAGDSIDQVVREVLAAGTNVAYATGGASAPSSRVTMAVDDLLVANDIRKQVAALRGANVATFNGSYIGFIHPDVSYDFRSAVDVASWRTPANYVNPEGIYNGEIGLFESVRFIETPRAKVFTNAFNGAGAAGTGDSYATLIMGRQALAKAFSTQDGNGAVPKVVRGNVTDTLMRLQPLGWYWLGGYGRFREASLRRIESASSIGTNNS
jgi:N4-gp56 family major capsid protein